MAYPHLLQLIIAQRWQGIGSRTGRLFHDGHKRRLAHRVAFPPNNTTSVVGFRCTGDFDGFGIE